MKFLSKFYIFIVFAILYAPILVVILFSFNASGNLSSFSGFTLYWYKDLFRSGEAIEALKNSLILALCSSALATVLGTLASFSIAHSKNKYYQTVMKSVTNIPMMNPDIVTGVSMMLLFVGAALIFKLNDVLGFWTMLIAHTTFCLPYVILSVLPRINELGNSLTEAALDLGCSPVRAFFKVKLPNILPGVLSGFVMAFTLSLDDFVISYFVGSSEFQTLPILIYNMTKKKVTPDMYALSTLIIITVFTLLFISNIKSGKTDKAKHKAKKRKAVAK